MKEENNLNYSSQVEKMYKVNSCPSHGCSPIPQEGSWTKACEIKDISGLSHGIGKMCTSTRRVQTNFKRQKWNSRRSTHRNHWMLWYDPFGSYGRRNFAWKNNFRMS